MLLCYVDLKCVNKLYILFIGMPCTYYRINNNPPNLLEIFKRTHNFFYQAISCLTVWFLGTLKARRHPWVTEKAPVYPFPALSPSLSQGELQSWCPVSKSQSPARWGSGPIFSPTLSSTYGLPYVHLHSVLPHEANPKKGSPKVSNNVLIKVYRFLENFIFIKYNFSEFLTTLSRWTCPRDFCLQTRCSNRD